jgi:hypothetical protein
MDRRHQIDNLLDRMVDPAISEEAYFAMLKMRAELIQEEAEAQGICLPSMYGDDDEC